MTKPSRWIIADRGAYLHDCGSRAEWISEWRRRVREIEAADRPVDLRRRSLEHSLIANAAAFQALVRHGALDAVIEVTGAIATADSRLSQQETLKEIAA